MKNKKCDKCRKEEAKRFIEMKITNEVGTSMAFGLNYCTHCYDIFFDYIVRKEGEYDVANREK